MRILEASCIEVLKCDVELEAFRSDRDNYLSCSISLLLNLGSV